MWDNMNIIATGGDSTSGECHGYFNRNALDWYFPSIIETMGSQTYDDYAEKVVFTKSE